MLGLGLAEAALQGFELAPREVEADGAQLRDEGVVAASGVGLPLERPKLAPHLSLEVLQAHEVLFGRLEAPLCAPSSAGT